jgi:Domain of unknown function (DU1801)
MPVEKYIAQQPSERRHLLNDIHSVIMKTDKTVTPVVEPMMAKEMIIYKANGSMKYGLASVKNHMSLHLLPMYITPKIYDKYKALLPKANFQKGCINFVSDDDMPLNIIKQLIADCAVINPVKIRENQLRAKKSAAKK